MVLLRHMYTFHQLTRLWHVRYVCILFTNVKYTSNESDVSIPYAFLGQVHDRLLYLMTDPHERIVPQIMKWFIGCTVLVSYDVIAVIREISWSGQGMLPIVIVLNNTVTRDANANVVYICSCCGSLNKGKQKFEEGCMCVGLNYRALALLFHSTEFPDYYQLFSKFSAAIIKALNYGLVMQRHSLSNQINNATLVPAIVPSRNGNRWIWSRKNWSITGKSFTYLSMRSE